MMSKTSEREYLRELKKKYYKAQTPYQRLIKTRHISKKQKDLLKLTYGQLNPIILKREIDRKIELIRRTLK